MKSKDDISYGMSFEFTANFQIRFSDHKKFIAVSGENLCGNLRSERLLSLRSIRMSS